MKRLFIIFGIIASLTAVILAVLPLFKLAFIPAAIALIFGILSYLQIKKEGGTKNYTQLIFIVTILTLALTIYKSVTIKDEIGNTKELEQREKASEKKAIKELEDLDITE